MNKTLTILLATTAIAFGSTAFAADQTYKAETKIQRNDDGSYNKDVSAERKDDSGAVSAEVSTDVDVDSNGDTTKKVVTKDVNDPKGLLNKQTTKTEQTTKVRDGKVTSESEKLVNGKKVEAHSTEHTSATY